MKDISRMKKKLKKIAKGKQIKESLKEAEGKVCSKCGNCCLGFHIPLATLSPDYRRYLSLHENCEIETRDGKDYLYVKNRCKHLGEDNLCNIYDERPQVCKDAYVKDRGKAVFYPEGCTMR